MDGWNNNEMEPDRDPGLLSEEIPWCDNVNRWEG